MSGQGFEYSARWSYESADVPANYEAERFSGTIGRYRYRREQRAVGAMVDRLPNGVTVLDCPCGNGRWWPLLARRARSILGVDVSRSMLDFAARRAGAVGVPVELLEGQAERLLLPDDSVDFVFSHALTKHLPVPVQYEVLREFGRVARQGVICSFGIFTPLTYAVWRRRRIPESYPVLPEELEWMAEHARLRVAATKKCTTPIGVEYSVFFTCAE